MPLLDVDMKREKGEVSVLELKRLLVELREQRPLALVRFRVMGSMWTEFVQLLSLNDNTVAVKDLQTNQVMFLSISNVMQFEIEERFLNFYPNNHYTVVPIKKNEVAG